MNYYQEIDSAESIFLTDLFEPQQNQLEFILAIGRVSEQQEDVFISGKNFGPTRRVQVTEDSEVFSVKFDSYISYAVVNESFELLKGEEYEGNRIRIYSDSNFLNYVKTETFATSDYPGEFKHYCFISLNHIVNVASVSEPEIEKVK